MATRRSHSKISRLPPEVRHQVEEKLIKGVTYAKISDYLQRLGYDINISCVWRYGKPFLKQYQKIVEAAEQAKAFMAARVNK